MDTSFIIFPLLTPFHNFDEQNMLKHLQQMVLIINILWVSTTWPRLQWQSWIIYHTVTQFTQDVDRKAFKFTPYWSCLSHHHFYGFLSRDILPHSGATWKISYEICTWFCGGLFCYYYRLWFRSTYFTFSPQDYHQWQCWTRNTSCVAIWLDLRDHLVYVPSQWEMTLQCNVVSHWLGT